MSDATRFHTFDRFMASRDHAAALASLETVEAALDPSEIHDALRFELDHRRGKVLLHLGDPASARALLERALTASEALHSTDHPTTISVHADLGAVLVVAGEYGAALVQLERTARLAEAHYGLRHVEVGRIRHNQGVLAHKLARYRDAATAFEQALQAREGALGPDHLDVAETLNGFGWVCAQAGDLDRAARLLERALEIKTAHLGPDHLAVAHVHQNLGGVHVFAREYAGARRHLQRAIEIAERHDPDHVVAVGSASNLSTVEAQLGLFERAKELAERALGAAERTLGPRHPIVASVVHNIASLYASEGDADAARPYAQRALELKRDRLGEDHADTARAHLELGRLDLEAGAMAPALEHAQVALEVFNRAYDGASLDVATALTLLARVHERAGELTAAQDAYQRAVQELESVFAPRHPHLSEPLLGLSRVARRQGAPGEALSLALRSLDVLSLHRQRAFAVLDQRRKLRVNAAVREELAAVFAAVDVAVGAELRRAVDHWLAFKGSVAAFQNRFEHLRSLGDDATIALLDEHEATLRRLAAASLALRPDEPASVDDLGALNREIDEQVAKLSEATSEQGLADLSEGASLEALSRALETDEAFVDYAWFDDALYAVAVRRDADVTLASLGEPALVADRIAVLRAAVSAGDDAAADRAHLFRLLIQPFLPAVAGARRLVIAADGVLPFLPFELLGDGDTQVQDRWEIAHVPNARAFVELRGEPPPAARRPPALFGDPDFADVDVAAWRGPAVQELEASSSMVTWIESLRFPRLPASRAEVRYIRERLPDAEVYLGADATAANLFALRGPRILHLATHGFVDEQDDPVVDPMLRAVLAFAGARTSVRERDDRGLVPALRLAGLDLRGTRLVVLSACDTSVGAVRAGEGVSSLDQALLVAGARAVVSTLWKVADEATATFMAHFYDAMAAGAPPATALHRVKAHMARTHPPRDWAAFVLSGDGWARTW